MNFEDSCLCSFLPCVSLGKSLYAFCDLRKRMKREKWGKYSKKNMKLKRNIRIIQLICKKSFIFLPPHETMEYK